MSQSLHARFRGLLWRCVLVQEKGESMLSGFMLLDFCEHNVSRKDCVSSGDAVEVFTGSVAETVLYEFLREAAKQVVVHGLVLEASQQVSCKLLCVGAGPSVYAVTWRSFVHNVLLERVWVRRSSYQERALVYARW